MLSADGTAIACCVAERITHASALLDKRARTAADVSTRVNNDDELLESARDRVRARVGTCDIVLTRHRICVAFRKIAKLRYDRCAGISRVWVDESQRRKRVGSDLLDCVRCVCCERDVCTCECMRVGDGVCMCTC
jgi:hypothetical protein